MNDWESVPRSLQRFIFMLLGEPWRVTLVQDPIPVADEKRPVATVQPTSDMETVQARRTIPQGDIRRRMTFVVTAYPALGADQRASAAEGRRVAQVLGDAIDVGTTDGGLHFTYPLTVPLWNYTGVAVDAGGPALPVGVLDVASHSVRWLADPEDPRRQTVPLTVQLEWWSTGRERKDVAVPPIATEMPGRFVIP